MDLRKPCSFLTNLRQVGGLPLVELNHLELQAYGTMLVEFYAREVADQHEREKDGN